MVVLFETYGCTLNKAEAREMAGLAVGRGFNVVISEGFPEGRYDIEAVVLCTCIVIQSTEDRMFNRIAALRSEEVPVIVAGCMASARSERVLKEAPDAVLLPPGRIRDLADVLVKLIGTPSGTGKGPRADAYGLVAIANGCLGNCSYCITKVARGVLKSVPPEKVLDMVARVRDAGAFEVRLASQDCGAYGKEIGTDLPELVSKVSVAIDIGAAMIRVGMANPDHVSGFLERYLNAFGRENVYKFFHIPVQSGSDAVLRNMGRRYTSGDYRKIARAIKGRFPDAVISTDIIVGFPNETRADFKATLSLIEDLCPEVINIKGFSPRRGTPAWDLERLDPQVMKERTAIVSDMHLRITHDVHERLVGRTFRAMAVEIVPGKGTRFRTFDYRPVMVGEFVSPGTFMQLEVTDARGIALSGTLIR